MVAMKADMKKRKDTSDYRRIFLEDVPLFDVRAPIEFGHGSMPGAVNLPLMMNDEREAVGITYKNEGQDAAIEKGYALVQGAVKAARIAKWAAFVDAHPEGYLLCMRGGLRSQISQRWMDEAGKPYPLVSGGYKALRRFLIEECERLVAKRDFIVVAGRTGAGKTDFLGLIENSIDLEGLANHRGSSFGRRLGDQPTQINFENALSVRLMKLDDRAEGPLFLEDESRRIGGLEIPLMLADKMAEAPALLVEEPLDARIDIIQRDYVTLLNKEYRESLGDEGFSEYSAFLVAALARIKKRLGGARYVEIAGLMQQALAYQKATGSEAAHRDWIKHLLVDYYDPMYEYQLKNKPRKILFSGSRADAVAWGKENG